MTRRFYGRLKDGRIPGVLTRRLLDAMVARPGRLVPLQELGPVVWPDGPPRHYRLCLAHQAKQLNLLLGAVVVERVGSGARIDGFRLHVSALPKQSVTAKPRKVETRFPWTATEDRVVRDGAASLPLSGLAAKVNAIHGHRHTLRSVEARIYELGLSKKSAAIYSAHSLAPILGVDDVKIARWIERGYLVATRCEPSRQATFIRRTGWWRIQHADVETFLRAYPWEVDWRQMSPSHPFTALARSVQRSDPYLTLGEVSRRTGLSHQTLCARIAQGYLRGAVRATPHEPESNPDLATWRIPLSALADDGHREVAPRPDNPWPFMFPPWRKP